jgi:hypothetical protein
MSHVLSSILAHPVQFLGGVFTLLAGLWALRKGGVLVLICLAVGVGISLSGYLESAGWLTEAVWGRLLVIGGLVLAALIAARHPIVARDGEILFVLAVCFLQGRTLSEWLHLSEPVVWSVLLIGTVVAPSLAIAAFSAALLSASLEVSSLLGSLFIFLGCLTAVRLLHGSWSRGHFDPRLWKDIHGGDTPRAFGRRSRATGRHLIPVVFGSANRKAQQRLIARLQRAGHKCEEFPGGYAGAELPPELVQSWRSPWAGTYRILPDWVFSGQHVVSLPPVSISSKGTGVPLTEVARRIRSDVGARLPDNVATGKGVKLAVLDTGINPVTPELQRAVAERVSFVPHEPRPDDQQGHGTAVGQCVAAVAPDVKLVSIKVLDGNGRGTLYSVMRGLLYVAMHRREITCANLSLGAHICGGRNACPLCRAMTELAKLGVASCTAIGNSGQTGSGSVECPGASPGTLGVAAVDINRDVAPWSSRGPCADHNICKPDLANFGVDLVLPIHDGSQIVASGTSFASPLTAGMLAACLELTGDKSRSNAELYDLLKETCVPAADGSADPYAVGAGVANLKKSAARLGVQATRFDGLRSRWSRLPNVRFRRHVLFPVGAAAVVIVAGLGWLLGLGHVGLQIGDTTQRREVWMLGRTHAHCEQPNLLVFDDGTGSVPLVWKGTDGSAPAHDSIILLRASWDGSSLAGNLRIQITL